MSIKSTCGAGALTDLMLARWSRSTKLLYTPGPVSTRMSNPGPLGLTPGAGKSISVHNQPPRPTQPGHSSVVRRNEYQPKGGDALRLGSKGCKYGSCVGGR